MPRATDPFDNCCFYYYKPRYEVIGNLNEFGNTKFRCPVANVKATVKRCQVKPKNTGFPDMNYHVSARSEYHIGMSINNMCNHLEQERNC